MSTPTPRVPQTAASSTELDAEELLHLAVASSQRGQTAQALAMLKQVVAMQPGWAVAHHLLGAEHAQIGLMDRAVSDMQQAVALDPAMHVARFQLGLLLIGQRRVDEAVQVWQGLDALGADHALVLFRDGMTLLAQDAFEPALQALRAGQLANHALPSLNVDMQKVIDGIEAFRASATPTAVAAPGVPRGASPAPVTHTAADTAVTAVTHSASAPPAPAGTHSADPVSHLWLNAYQKQADQRSDQKPDHGAPRERE